MALIFPVAVLENNGDFDICSSLTEVYAVIEPADIDEVKVVDLNGVCFKIELVEEQPSLQKVVDFFGAPRRYVFSAINPQMDERDRQRICEKLRAHIVE